MIAFETLLLGIIFGRVPIRVMVAPPVTTVEFRLDGASIGTLVGPPWVIEHDFGRSPLPHELTAIGSDAAGHEVGRVTQWVNFGRERAAVSALLERDPMTRQPVAATVAWNEATGDKPLSARATLDGAPLPVTDPSRIAVPNVDLAQPHLLSVEVAFPHNLQARTDLAFGGDIIDTAESELTAVAVALPPDKESLEARDLQRAFSIDGVYRQPVAVEKGRAEVVLVMDRRVQDEILFRKLPWGWSDAGFSRSDRFWGDEDRFLAVDTVPETRHVATGGSRILFRHTARRLLSRIDEFSLLFGISSTFQSGPVGDQTIPDAVAVAGREVAAGNHRRAVVVVLAELPAAERVARSANRPSVVPTTKIQDSYRFDIAAVKAYLAALDVPLFVWSLTGATPGPITAEWGPAESVSTPRGLRAAAKKLEVQLAAQRIVWFAGRYLPQRITLDESVTGLRLAP
jgi:hypothetical protein